MATNRHALAPATGWLALMGLHWYNLLALFGLGHFHLLLTQWDAKVTYVSAGY